MKTDKKNPRTKKERKKTLTKREKKERKNNGNRNMNLISQVIIKY